MAVNHDFLGIGRRNLSCAGGTPGYSVPLAAATRGQRGRTPLSAWLPLLLAALLANSVLATSSGLHRAAAVTAAAGQENDGVAAAAITILGDGVGHSAAPHGGTRQALAAAHWPHTKERKEAGERLKWPLSQADLGVAATAPQHLRAVDERAKAVEGSSAAAAKGAVAAAEPDSWAAWPGQLLRHALGWAPWSNGEQGSSGARVLAEDDAPPPGRRRAKSPAPPPGGGSLLSLPPPKGTLRPPPPRPPLQPEAPPPPLQPDSPPPPRSPPKPKPSPKRRGKSPPPGPARIPVPLPSPKPELQPEADPAPPPSQPPPSLPLPSIPPPRPPPPSPRPPGTPLPSRAPPRPPPPPKSPPPAMPYTPVPPLMPDLPPLAPSSPPESPDILPPQPTGLLNIGRFSRAGTSMIVAVHMAAVPGTDRFLFMERPSGYHPDRSNTIAGFFDVPTGGWSHIMSPDGLFCCGHTMLDSGDVLIVGGHQANAGYPDGMKSIRTFNRSCADLQLRKIRDMGWRRWYPSATLLPDGRVLIMGGTQGVGAGTANNPFWEMYDPRAATVTPYGMRPGYLDSANQVYYPFNYVLPSGHLFTFCGRAGFILDWTNNEWRQPVPRLRGYASTQFPFTGTSVMLGLYPERGYQVEVMLFGGQKEAATKDLSLKANRGSNRLTLFYDDATSNYTFGGWVEEYMSVGRVMPDSVLLPNGQVVILSGAQTGLAGDSSGGGGSRADFPVLYAELYNPDAPQGRRFSQMAWSQIARMYHSTACLTTNGTVIVAGCDRCYKFQVTDGWDYSPSPTSKAEYRVEIFSPPFFFMDNLKPAIVDTQAEVMGYGDTFRITYGFPSAVGGGPGGAPLTFNGRPASGGGRGNGGKRELRVTRAVLVAPCSCTHSFNTHQRLVGLSIESDSPADGALVVRGPPDINIAPPGMYMLFLLNGEVYSRAAWVLLKRP